MKIDPIHVHVSELDISIVSVQIDTDGKFFVSNGGLPNIYSTAQFHFHWGHKSHHGSEHTIDGKAAPIEVNTTRIMMLIAKFKRVICT